MSRNQRAGDDLWKAASPAQNDRSAVARIGSDANVAIFIKNAGGDSATFKVQCGGSPSPSAGRNSASVDWYDYADTVGGGDTTFTVAAGDSVCFDFSPFAPSALSLVCTTTGATAITAFVQTSG